MKTAIVFASALASASSALAAPTETWYSIAASAPNTKIDGVVIGASAESFYISKPSTSSCGDVNPYITVNSGGNMLFYNDGTSNQQQGTCNTTPQPPKPPATVSLTLFCGRLRQHPRGRHQGPPPLHQGRQRRRHALLHRRLRAGPAEGHVRRRRQLARLPGQRRCLLHLLRQGPAQPPEQGQLHPL